MIKTGTGEVGICFHDEDFRIVPIADSFSSFIDKLEEDSDML